MNWTTLLSIITLFVALPIGTIHAQTATATLSGPDTVRQGEVLQLTFAFEDLDASTFELPELVGLTPVGGPSRQTSMSFINGKRSSSSALMYRVVAEQAGLAFVPEVTLLHDGEEIKTESLQVFITEDVDYVPMQQERPSQRAPLQPKKKRRPTVKL